MGNFYDLNEPELAIILFHLVTLQVFAKPVPVNKRILPFGHIVTTLHDINKIMNVIDAICSNDLRLIKMYLNS